MIKRFKKHLRHPTDRVLIFVMVSIIALMAAIFWYDNQQIKYWRDAVYGSGSPDQQQQNGVSWTQLKLYIQEADQGLYANTGVVDPLNNRVYFPEMKVFVPLSQQARSLHYFYAPGDKSVHQPAEAEFINQIALNRLVNDLNDVPCVQHMVAVGVNQPADYGLHGDGTLKLADGRTLYFSVYQNQHCQQSFWGGVTPQ